MTYSVMTHRQIMVPDHYVSWSFYCRCSAPTATLTTHWCRICPPSRLRPLEDCPSPRAWQWKWRSKSCLFGTHNFCLKMAYDTVSYASEVVEEQGFWVGNSVGWCLGVRNPIFQPVHGRVRPCTGLVSSSPVWYFCLLIQYPKGILAH